MILLSFVNLICS